MLNQKQKIIEAYRDKETTETFDEDRSKYKFERYKHKIEADFLKKTIKLIEKDKIKILDVACGTGRMLPEIFSVDDNIEYFGLDTSKEMLKLLEEKSKKLNKKKSVKIKIGDACKIPFKNNEFDIVFSYHLLWHLPKDEQKKIIKEMLRVCKEGGFVIFDILNKNFVLEKFKEIFGEEKTGGIYKLSINDAKKIIGIENNSIDIEKLLDAPIKNNLIYRLFNIINNLRKIFPQSLYHMIYLRVKR